MNNKRRNILKGGLALGGAATFAAGYSPKIKEIARGILGGTSGEKTQSAVYGNALVPEYHIVNNRIMPNPEQVVCNTQCMGCWTLCGVRARVDLKQNKVLRIAGNSYHPLSADHYLDYNASIQEAELSVGASDGIAKRSTACARGSAFMDGIASPYRITQPLKRVGKRGEGKWKTISFEQLIEEVTKGGDLFGEGHIDGLQTIRDLQTPVDSENPDFGPKVNQLMVTFAGPEGRQPLLKRFANQSFGTINFASHGSFCGLSYRAGSGAFMNDLDKNAHAKPDWDNCEFILFMGTSPAQAGNPFKRQARQLAKQRTDDTINYVVVAPRLELTSSQATQNNRWIPIIPGGDLSLALAMLRWIIEHERYNADYLSRPSQAAMQQAQGVSYCNATHLFITDKNHPRYGQAITLEDFTGEHTSLENTLPEDNYVVKDQKNQQFVAAKTCLSAVLWVDETITLRDGSKVHVKSAMTLLKESCFEHSLEAYSQQCGVPLTTIIALAKEFTSHGHKAVAITHGGTMQSNGFYTAWAILLLNAMVGNMNKKGGMSFSGGKFKDFAAGPRYNLSTFDGMVKPKGTNLARSKKAYEKSSEYRRKVEAGENPYPSQSTWYPFVGGQMSEMITSALQGYPYPLKAWISHMSNPLYGMTGIHHIADKKLRDPSILPLFIAIDAFMNETTALADYIVPDTHNFESWGFSTPWAGVPTKTSTARWPIITSPNAKTAKGDVICMESFIIAVANMLNLPGFGDNAISDKQNHKYPLNRSEDFFLRAAANVAFDGKAPVNEASEDDLLLTGVQRLLPELEKTLKPEEVLKVATVYCKGGRFSPYNSAWQGDNMATKWKNCLQLWNATVAGYRHHHNGEHYHGCPRYYPAQFADNTPVTERYPTQVWPFKLTSFKSNIMSSITAPLLRLHSIKPNGIVAMNSSDAKQQQLQQGDVVKLSTPGGEAILQLFVLDGVMPGTIAIEHGYGHKQLGASGYTIDGKHIAGNPQIKQGININDLGLLDTSKAIQAPWLDWVCGSAVRQGLPAKIEKL
ncbi:tetrathionate reductase subunit A [Spirabiliibacterium falconis]|uniref:tetrathionate reductase subunit A n=1 Tax=Spirabiliibacterium falconis TaxID=572023 RepID=UPI001AAD1263|nr:tetrathionate reductase subunit A [Spirabiliibacterium falconis]MBE2894350.1 tetrathionate reductase subunit TtrA [Spirabiliibacterium falconis]